MHLYNKELIAPCGMNCGICIGHLRDKKPCGACFKIDDVNKPKHCRSCSIANCEFLEKTKSGYCYECEKYPCRRLKNLDKRYRLKYGMSMIGNLNFINSLLAINGFSNASVEPIRYPTLTSEEIQNSSADLILLSSEPYPFSEKHISKIKNLGVTGKVVLVDGEYFSWYGSRLQSAFAYFKKLHLNI